MLLKFECVQRMSDSFAWDKPDKEWDAWCDNLAILLFNAYRNRAPSTIEVDNIRDYCAEYCRYIIGLEAELVDSDKRVRITVFY